MSSDWTAGLSGGPATEADGGRDADQPPAAGPGQVQQDLELLDRVDATLSAVELSLRRLDEGTYGACEVCGAALSAEDLEANPLKGRCDLHPGQS